MFLIRCSSPGIDAAAADQAAAAAPGAVAPGVATPGVAAAGVVAPGVALEAPAATPAAPATDMPAVVPDAILASITCPQLPQKRALGWTKFLHLGQFMMIDSRFKGWGTRILQRTHSHGKSRHARRGK